MAASSEGEIDGGRLLVRPRVGVSLVFGPLRAIQHRFCTSPSSKRAGLDSSYLNTGFPGVYVRSALFLPPVLPECRFDDSSRLSGMSRNYLTGPTAPVRPVLLSAVTGSRTRMLPAIIPLPPPKRRAAREKILKTDPGSHKAVCLLRTNAITRSFPPEALTLGHRGAFKSAVRCAPPVPPGGQTANLKALLR